MIIILAILFASLAGLVSATPYLLPWISQTLGSHLKRRTLGRRAQLLERVALEEKAHHSKGKGDSAGEEEWEKVEGYTLGTAGNGEAATKEWEGIIGFLHPFCNAGGGGERVLWAAIRATQQRWPKAVCIVYTGDEDVDKAAMLERARTRFNIDLHAPTIAFLYLSTRHYVLGSTYPHLTLLGQSVGSLLLAYDAFSLLVPDIFVDTMGYAFTLAMSKLLFPPVPTAAYVHYPTISTDMLSSLTSTSSGADPGKPDSVLFADLYRNVKHTYWQIFAKAYSWAGGHVDLVMTNSSWTQAHITSLWEPHRRARSRGTRKSSILREPISVLFPPVAVSDLEQAIPLTASSSPQQREKVVLCIAQFRPEKNHALVLQAFAAFHASGTPAARGAKLVLVGSVRDSDDATRVYKLRLLAHELGVRESVEFVTDAPWAEILEWLGRSSVGVNGMWNEHFGIGVVEYQAAGLVSVVHNSGGPKMDIVVEVDGGPTGFHATTAEEFAAAFQQAFSLSAEDTLSMRRRARSSARRFTDEVFSRRWVVEMEKLIEFQGKIRAAG